MMDEDEVTREPFEDQHEEEEEEEEEVMEASSLSSWKQPRYDHRVALGDGNHDQHDDHPEGDDEETLVQAHQTSGIYGPEVVVNTDDDDEDGDDCSSAGPEDVEFAKSYGIQLQSSKSQAAAYERLMNSDYIEDSSNDTVDKQSGDQGKLEPCIKTSVTSDCIYHKGTFYQKGDIVALCDQDDDQIYFAQLTGFLQDQYCEKSATINWLVPTRPTSRDFFDPLAYKIGLEDVQLRKLDCMTFVRHCSHDYYLRKFFQSTDEAVPTTASSNERQRVGISGDEALSYIWTTIERCSLPVFEPRTSKSS